MCRVFPHKRQEEKGITEKKKIHQVVRILQFCPFCYLLRWVTDQKKKSQQECRQKINIQSCMQWNSKNNYNTYSSSLEELSYLSVRTGSENFRASELRRSLETIKANQSLYFPAGEAEAQRADIKVKWQIQILEPKWFCFFLLPHHKWNCQSKYAYRIMTTY